MEPCVTIEQPWRLATLPTIIRSREQFWTFLESELRREFGYDDKVWVENSNDATGRWFLCDKNHRVPIQELTDIREAIARLKHRREWFL